MRASGRAGVLASPSLPPARGGAGSTQPGTGGPFLGSGTSGTGLGWSRGSVFGLGKFILSKVRNRLYKYFTTLCTCSFQADKDV